MGDCATIRHCSATVGSRDLGILSAMSDDRMDPSQNTQAFQAWVDNQPAAEPARSKVLPVALAVAAAAVVVVVLVVVFAL
ncbi:hypothetical protein GCM10007977_098810 [Dactylosporangium sucinum]|uniref:Uncharacterized protein n=1 Tax=Dactylosporangium sucinum TaxID=1424081 RepID=A0A917UCJ7_9ACTN|nr:hypothetical protein GCM10007977_098810 [Dactylosporangium sucinum]